MIFHQTSTRPRIYQTPCFVRFIHISAANGFLRLEDFNITGYNQAEFRDGFLRLSDKSAVSGNTFKYKLNDFGNLTRMLLVRKPLDGPRLPTYR